MNLKESNYYARLRKRLYSEEGKDIKRRGFIITGENFIKPNSTSYIAYRSDQRPPNVIFGNGFYSNTANFEIWEIRLGYGPDGMWQNFKKGQPGAQGSDRQELNQMMMKVDSAYMDIDDLSCVSLTTRASIAPVFPCFSEKPEEHLGIRWLYAVCVDNYFDAHSCELQRDPKNPAVQFDEIAVHDIPRGHVLAAIECNVTKRVNNTIRYEALGTIFWNIDDKDMNILKGVTKYHEKRSIVETQFSKLIKYEHLDIHAKPSEKIIVKGALTGKPSKTNTVAPSFFKSRQQELSLKFPLKAPTVFQKKNYEEQFKQQLLLELKRVATDKNGTISPERQVGINDYMNHATAIGIYNYARKEAKSLEQEAVKYQKQGSMQNAILLLNHSKNLKIILKEFYHKHQEEKQANNANVFKCPN